MVRFEDLTFKLIRLIKSTNCADINSITFDITYNIQVRKITNICKELLAQFVIHLVARGNFLLAPEVNIKMRHHLNLNATTKLFSCL